MHRPPPHSPFAQKYRADGGPIRTEHWCEYCRTWIRQHAAAIAMHEQGEMHKKNVAKRLHELRVKAQKEKEEEELASKSMAGIEEEARKAYEADIAAAEEAKQALGEWVRAGWVGGEDNGKRTLWDAFWGGRAREKARAGVHGVAARPPAPARAQNLPSKNAPPGAGRVRLLLQRSPAVVF